jgi:hypothetical protein
MANFCGRCGTPAVTGQKFCPKCGLAVTDAAPAVRRVRRLLLGALFLFLVAGAILTYALLRYPRPPSQTTTIAAPIDLSSLPGSKFEVTYKPETVVLDPATTKKSFEGVSADGALFVFNTSSPAIRGLHAGSVLLLQGLALKKVVAVENHGESIIIATQPATLTDAIQDGRIQWDAPISFAADSSRGLPSGPAVSPAFLFAGSQPVALVAAPDAKSGSEGDWKYTTTATKEAGQLNLDVDIKGAIDGTTVDVTGRGHVQSFGLLADIQITHGVIEQFKYVAKNLRGDVTVHFLAKKTGDGLIKGLEVKLPTPFQAPLPIGGIPFVLSIGEAVIVKPALSGKNTIAEGEFTIKYGGGQGFSVSGPAMAAEGQPEGENKITASSSAGMAPFAYILAFAMPRVELTLGLEKATGFEALSKAIPTGIADRAAELLSKSGIGGQIAGLVKKTLKSEAAAHMEMVMLINHLDSGPLALLPCKKTTLEVYARVGYDVNALGQTAEGSKEMDLGTKQVIQQVPPGIRCGE